MTGRDAHVAHGNRFHAGNRGARDPRALGQSLLAKASIFAGFTQTVRRRTMVRPLFAQFIFSAA